MGILQARILEWLAIAFSRKSSQPRDRTCVSSIAGRFFTDWANGKAFLYELENQKIHVTHFIVILILFQSYLSLLIFICWSCQLLKELYCNISLWWFVHFSSYISFLLCMFSGNVNKYTQLIILVCVCVFPCFKYVFYNQCIAGFLFIV